MNTRDFTPSSSQIYDDGSINTVTRYSGNGAMVVARSSYTKSDGVTSGNDGMGRLTDLKETLGSGATVTSYTWTYDANSRITGMTNSAHPGENFSGSVYDATDQLQNVNYNGGLSNESYTYDDNGNRKTTNGSPDSTSTGNRLTYDGTYRYLYDGEGNRIARYSGQAAGSNNRVPSNATDVTIYEWDFRNRLTKVTHYRDYQAGTTDSVVEYTYNYLGRRILRKIDPDGASSNPVDYYYNVYQGNNVALEIHDPDDLADNFSANGVVLQRDASVSHRYLYGQAVDEILATDDGSNVLWDLADNEGTIHDIVNNFGAFQSHRAFDSFGKLTSGTIDNSFPFGFTGFWTDTTTGMAGTTSRWYDPNVGRWLSEDPAGLSIDANLFRYVRNNPLNKTDPTGLCGIHSTADPYLGNLSGLSGLGNDLSFQYAANQYLTGSSSTGSYNYGLGNTVFAGIPAPIVPSVVAPAQNVKDMTGLTRLLATTKYNGDLGIASARMDRYITDLAFVIKNPTLGTNPGSGGGYFTYSPEPQMATFSDKITEADKELARQSAIDLLPGYLLGEHPNDPLTVYSSGVFSQWQQLDKLGMARNISEDNQYHDLSLWGQAYVNAYRRATMGETNLEQAIMYFGQPDNMNAMICAFGGFAGIGANGLRIEKTEPDVYARVNENVGEDGVNSEIHHVMTNKNSVSTAAGGPYTTKFEALAQQRGITLEDAMNKLNLSGHQGPHPEYNAQVFRRLDQATQGLRGDAFNQAFDNALHSICTETATPGSALNRLATGKGR